MDVDQLFMTGKSGHPPYIFHNALTYKSVPLVRSKACHKLAKKLPGLGSLLQL
jgi:hypothetical protein